MLSWLVWRFFYLWRFLSLSEVTGWTFRVGYDERGEKGVVHFGFVEQDYYNTINSPVKYPNILSGRSFENEEVHY